MNTQHSSRRAVTLVEVLVTVAVTVILTLIIIVSLRSVRGQTLAMKDLHNLRLSGQDMLLWSADNDEKFLNIESPTSRVYQSAFAPFVNSGPRTFWAYYYSQPHDWNRMLGFASKQRQMHWHSAFGLPAMSPELQWAADRNAELWRRNDPQVTVQLSRFRYTLTLVTRPELWDNDNTNAISADTSTLEQYAQAVRVSNVKFPSGKGMLSNNFLAPEDTEHTHVAFVDGSVERRTRESMIEPAVDPASFQGVPGYPVQHTLHGYNGRDR